MTEDAEWRADVKTISYVVTDAALATRVTD